MPKLDPTRNYYADLEVSPTASVDEIKKQFRKLVNRDTQALLEYEEIHGKMRPKPTLHPLGGPLQPTMRKPAQLRGLIATQTSRVVPREAANPPLRRTALMPGAIIKPGRACDQTLAADRSPSPPPGRAPTSATRESKASEPEPSIPRAASQKQKAQASFGNSARRAGYTPRSPGLGDEPPVTNKNYFTDRTHTNIFNEMSASAARKARNSGTVPPDPLAQFRENYMEGHRSTPYHTPGGEKTSLFDEGSGLGRAKSTREPGSRKEGGGRPRHRHVPFPDTAAA
ncbi:uncharacterized protein PG998_003448 [Apiospora kogelbergensis]|uniref:uncharacterized protein n=1 Tax=Apiospora kogelbergensis TaxID=1337665 RepID=UPI00313240E0